MAASNFAPHHLPSNPSRAAWLTAVRPLNMEKLARPQTPIDMGDLTLKMRNIFRKRSGRPRSLIKSGGQGSKASNER